MSRPPRQAWDDETPWLATGVGIPDLVRLAHAVPDAFPGGAPLSVDEAVEAARGTWLASALAAGGRVRAAPAGALAARRARRYCTGITSAWTSGPAGRR